MADEKKRIINYSEVQDYDSDDYALLDSVPHGSHKIKIKGNLVKVGDVQVDGTSVMDGDVAKINLAGKQNVLTAGSNIQINGDTISATDTTYSAGTNVQISNQNVISATDTTYSDFAGSTHGLVPPSSSGDANKFLKGDGTWGTPSSVNNTITPTLLSGTKIAEYDVGGSSGDLYAPDPTDVQVTATYPNTGTKVGTVSVDNTDVDLYAPNPGSTVAVTQIQPSGTKIATVTVDGVATDLYSPSSSGGSLSTLLFSGYVGAGALPLSNAFINYDYLLIVGQGMCEVSTFIPTAGLGSDVYAISLSEGSSRVHPDVHQVDPYTELEVTSTTTFTVHGYGIYITEVYGINLEGGGSDVSVTQIQSTGTKIATVTVDNVDTDLYAPDGGSEVEISNTLVSGTRVATLSIDGIDTDINVPVGNAVEQVPKQSGTYNMLLSGASSSSGEVATEGNVGKHKGVTYNVANTTVTITHEDPDPSETTELIDSTTMSSPTTYFAKNTISGYSSITFDDVSNKVVYAVTPDTQINYRWALLGYKHEISSDVKQIKVKLENIVRSADHPDHANYDIIIGVKSEYHMNSQPPYWVQVDDADWVAMGHFDPGNETSIEYTLDINSSTGYYLYIEANDWTLDISEIKLVSYANPIITTNNIKHDDIVLSGTSNTWDGTHTSLKDAIAAGGGGTTVVANPSEAATDDLTKIQIGTTIYDIPGGGSGLTPVELTKAQYDALTTEQKNDPNKIYFVTDYNPDRSGDRINSTAAINAGGGDALVSSLYATGTDIVHS